MSNREELLQWAWSMADETVLMLIERMRQRGEEAHRLFAMEEVRGAIVQARSFEIPCSRISPDDLKAFLEDYKDTISVKRSCERLGLNPRDVYWERSHNELFHKFMEETIENLADVLEIFIMKSDHPDAIRWKEKRGLNVDGS